jgi:hypothetical protein
MKQDNHIYITKTMLFLEVSFFMIIVIWVVKENFHLILNQKFPPKKWKSIHKTIAELSARNILINFCF